MQKLKQFTIFFLLVNILSPCIQAMEGSSSDKSEQPLTDPKLTDITSLGNADMLKKIGLATTTLTTLLSDENFKEHNSYEYARYERLKHAGFLDWITYCKENSMNARETLKQFIQGGEIISDKTRKMVRIRRIRRLPGKTKAADPFYDKVLEEDGIVITIGILAAKTKKNDCFSEEFSMLYHESIDLFALRPDDNLILKNDFLIAKNNSKYPFDKPNDLIANIHQKNKSSEKYIFLPFEYNLVKRPKQCTPYKKLNFFRIGAMIGCIGCIATAVASYTHPNMLRNFFGF